MTNRILVTGANGFLGRHLVRALVSRGDFVVRLLRDLPLSVESEPAGVVGDIRDMALLERTIAEYEINAVVHLAAQVQVSVAEADPTGTLDTNVRGTWTVLEACRRQRVRQIILSSSDKVYGDGPIPYVEEQQLFPHGVYATSKACGDMLAHSYARDFGMSIAVTRCANLYGPGHANWSTLIPGTIRSVLRGERPIIRSDGSLRRDYLFVDDAVEGYLRLMSPVYAVGAFNFGTGRSYSVESIVRNIITLAGSDLEPVIQGTAAAAREIRHQAVHFGYAQTVLSWEPKHNVAEGLAKTIPWYRDHLVGGHQ